MGMENETRDFLVRIVNTISLILLWMMANVLMGIYFELGFFEGTPSIYNLLYYIGSSTSLFFVIRFLKRKWNL